MQIGTHSQHLTLVEIVEREIGFLLLLKILQHVVGVADGLIGCSPDACQTVAQIVVVVILILGEGVRA